MFYVLTFVWIYTNGCSLISTSTTTAAANYGGNKSVQNMKTLNNQRNGGLP